MAFQPPSAQIQSCYILGVYLATRLFVLLVWRRKNGEKTATPQRLDHTELEFAVRKSEKCRKAKFFNDRGGSRH
jgi:hypothetical protein